MLTTQLITNLQHAEHSPATFSVTDLQMGFSVSVKIAVQTEQASLSLGDESPSNNFDWLPEKP